MNEHAEVRCLVVEDDDDVYKKVRDALVANVPGVHDVPRARSFSEFERVQQKRLTDIDVVIIDLALTDPETGVLDSDEGGGLRVTEKVRLWEPDAIVVVFSATIDIPKTVAAMRRGAWDCIDKSQQYAYHELVKSVRDGLLERGSSKWIERNYHQLQANYAGQYVAVSNSKFVGANENLEELKRIVRKERDETHVEYALICRPIRARRESERPPML